MEDFKDLVTKKKSELVKLAKKEDIKSPSQKKKNDLIRRLGSLNQSQKKVLPWKASKVRKVANELGVEYTTKGETQARIAEKMGQSYDADESSTSDLTWEEEFRKACKMAIRNVIKKKRSYNVFEEDEESKTFNIRPMYMKNPEGKKPLITIVNYRQ